MSGVIRTGLNKQSGNMYPFVTHTWNPIRGECPHQCAYCYMKRFKVGKLRLEEKELRTKLGSGNFIFVGSSTDMWAEEVPDKWIKEVLEYTRKFPENTYLFQTKNPLRFLEFIDYFGLNYILGVTLETNRDYKTTKAPEPTKRWADFILAAGCGFRKMVSIEPIMDFDLEDFIYLLKTIDPEFVSIGADSKSHSLPEPSPAKVGELISELKKFTEVKIKKNLFRIINKDSSIEGVRKRDEVRR